MGELAIDTWMIYYKPKDFVTVYTPTGGGLQSPERADILIR